MKNILKVLVLSTSTMTCIATEKANADIDIDIRDVIGSDWEKPDYLYKQGNDWLTTFNVRRDAYDQDQQKALNYLAQAMYYSIKEGDYRQESHNLIHAILKNLNIDDKAAEEKAYEKAEKIEVKLVKTRGRKYLRAAGETAYYAKLQFPRAYNAFYHLASGMVISAGGRDDMNENYVALYENILLPHHISLTITLGPDAGKTLPAPAGGKVPNLYP